MGIREIPSGVIRSSHWPKQVGMRPDERGVEHIDNQGEQPIQTERQGAAVDTMINNIEALTTLWTKDDTSWDTTEVLGEHRKKLKPLSTDYKHRKTKLLGHVIRAGEEDPMRKVTFVPGTVTERGFAHRRVGRPRQQWLYESKKLAWKKCRHMEDKHGHSRPDKRTKYKEKPLQEAYLHTWAEERHFKECSHQTSHRGVVVLCSGHWSQGRFLSSKIKGRS